MFKLAHISDVHLSPLPPVRTRDLFSKRITGYANWTFNRKKSHGGTALEVLTADIKAHKPDHIAVTGDLVNLALDVEITAARKWLESLGSPDGISVVPGNHDAYVPGALAKACREWRGYIPHTVGSPSNSVNALFPYERRFDNVALIGVSSAVASAFFLSTGRFRSKQAEKLKTLLNKAHDDGLFRVIMIHHPPFRYEDDAAKRLYGIRLFQRTLAAGGAELVLHGHTHLKSYQRIGGRGADVPVIGVPSGAQSPGGDKPAATWNSFEIAGLAGAWNCNWVERSVQADGTVTETSSRALWQNSILQIKAS